MDTATMTVIALCVVLFGLVSERLRRGLVTAPMAFLVFGALIGVPGLGLLDSQPATDSMYLVAKLTLIVMLFTDASRVDLGLLRTEHRIPVRLLAIGLPLCIIGGTVSAWWLFPQLGFWQAAVLATVVAPTDAALAHAVVTNRLVPIRIRQAISVESGLNDGICLPLFLIFVCGVGVAEHPETAAWVRFFALQIGLGPLVGIGIGLVGATLIERADARGWISDSFLELAALALALLAFGSAELAEGNGFLAVFTAGLTVGRVSPTACKAMRAFADAGGQLLMLLVFLGLGAFLAGPALGRITLSGAAFVVLALTVLRVVPALISLVGTELRVGSRVMIGWFGPRGVASLVFALLLLDDPAVPARQEIVTVAIVTVVLSVFCHGMTARPLLTWVAGRVGPASGEAPGPLDR